MKSKKETTRLGEVVKLVTDKIELGAISKSNYISTDNMLPNFGGIEEASTIPRLKKVNAFQSGDILFSNIRTYFKKLWFANIHGGCSADVLVFRPKNNDIDNRFLYYVLQNNGFISYTVTTSKGTKMPRGDRTAILNYQFNKPPLSDQKKIAYVLSTLDDKIALNKKINQTLEFIAQTIFKSWFVDFDPVHAKANAQSEDEYDAIAKELGISREILDLFPSEFEESELGLIPMGWSIEKLGACELEIESGRRPKGGIDKTLKFGVPSIGAESIQSPIGTFDYSNVKYVSQEFSKAARKGWGKNFGVMLYKDGGSPGLFKPRISLYGEGFPFEEFMINEHVFILRSKMLGQFYLYYLIASDSMLEQLIAKGSSKAAQPGLNQDEVKDSYFALPPAELLGAYNKIIANMVRLQLNQGKENNWLSKTRDTLIPKLLSGEINVSNLNPEPAND